MSPLRERADEVLRLLTPGDAAVMHEWVAFQEKRAVDCPRCGA